MRTKFLASLALVIAAPAVQAVPIPYEVSFVATQGPSGVGSFVWDEDVRRMSDFVWNFSGMTGGVVDDYWLNDGYGGAYAYELFSGLDTVADVNCAVPPYGCRIPTSVTSYAYGWPVSAPGGYIAEFASVSMAEGPVRSYFFSADGMDLYGRLTIEPVPVPEPGALSLICLGLSALILFRCHRGTS